jgi:hypothetical protein
MNMPSTADYDVLVLGAGAAGLAAARVLTTSGRRVAVIEARARSGGRIFTQHASVPGAPTTVPVELGAEFVHGLPAESWGLIRAAGLATYELRGSTLVFADGSLQSAHDEPGAGPVLDDMASWLSRQPPGTDSTFAAYLAHVPLDEPQRAAAIRYVEGFNAADQRLIGIAALARQQAAELQIEGNRLYRLRAGYDRLPRFLEDAVIAAGGSLFFERIVATVEWQCGRVSFCGNDAAGHAFRLSGRGAVITLPLGVLQAGSVRFSPRPHSVLEDASRMAMGDAIRVPMLFRSRFWSDRIVTTRHPAAAAALSRLSFLFTDRGAPSTWWSPAPDPTAMLTAWVAGPNAGLIDRRQLIAQCVKTLAGTFDLPAAFVETQLAASYFHDWSTDEFARGAYSYAPAGALDASARMAEPVDRTLYFAGEHTCVTGHWGTVHGALQSGAAAAARLTADASRRG